MVVIHHETVGVVVLLVTGVLLLRLFALLQQLVLDFFYLKECIFSFIGLFTIVSLVLAPTATSEHQPGMAVVLREHDGLIFGVEIAAELHNTELLVAIFNSLLDLQ